MTITSLEKVEAKFSEFVESVHSTNERVVITRHGAPAAVLISPSDLASLEETITLLSDRQAMEEINEARSAVARGETIPADMLRRLLESAGQDLTLSTTTSSRSTLASLSNAWSSEADEQNIDWTRLRAFLDVITQSPNLLSRAIEEAPPSSGSTLLDNLLAGIAETVSIEAELSPPRWTARVRALETEWITPGTPRIQERARVSTPPALSARGITLARSSLWRDRVDV